MLRVRRAAFVGAVADPLPILDHGAYVTQHVDVGDGVAFHRDQVGELAGRDRTELAFAAEQARGLIVADWIACIGVMP